ncbi:MIF4G domain-containing protein-like [Clavelina lepadiformis]|uniref:MIF4G domain-containing protein-like n=1 Tax=Clavelina lepadiformis TaxID=159417 RepID=UPI004040ED43
MAPQGRGCLDDISKLDFGEDQKLLILKAIDKPSAIEIEKWKKVVDILTSKAVSNPKNGRIAAKICDGIAKSEISQLSEGDEKYFRKLLLTSLQQEYKKHQKQDYTNHKSWIGFVNFLCGIFDILHVNNMPLMALIVPVYEVLGVLTDAQFIKDESAIQCLVVQLQFIGEELDRLNKAKMDKLIEKLREVLLSPTTTQLSSLMLLEILELRSGNWKLSPAAYKYYYEEDAKA